MSATRSHRRSQRRDAVCELAIVGAGPGGLSAGARAVRHRMSHVLLEASDKHANTIQQYQRHKHVMSEPSMLPLRSDMGFTAGLREEILETWDRAIQDARLRIRYQAEVTEIQVERGGFRLTLKSGEAVRARQVILALGVQGNPRRLKVPGGQLPCVQYTLESAEDLQGERIVVIGAGDAAIENAVSLAKQNKVTLLNRGEGFPRAKEGNAAKIARAIAAGQVECISHADVKSLEKAPADSPFPYRMRVTCPEGERSVPVHRVIARMGAVPARALLESAGVRFVSEEPDAVPELSETYESSIPGLYVIGALAGFPLIKQAMNQGYEVVERLAGWEVEPADQGILAAKLSGVRGGADVDTMVSRIQRVVQMFHEVKPLALRELLLASAVLTPRRGEQLYAQGDYGASLYAVLGGEVHLTTSAGLRLRLAPGEVFGEMALLSGRPHETTAVAGRRCVILTIPQAAISRLMRAEAAVRNHVDTLYVQRALRFLLLPHAAASTVDALSKAARLDQVKAGDALFKEGEPSERFHIVCSGSVTLTRSTAGQGEVTVAYCAAGSCLDAAGCLSGDPVRTSSARATVATVALSLDLRILRRLLGSDRRLRDKLQADARQELARMAQMLAQPEAGAVFSSLMSDGLGEATSVLVIDETLCVGCDQCEQACAATHGGVSRLDRSAGSSFHSLHLPTSCRHCEQPHCMKDCPPGAIHRLVDGEVSIDSTCIGCGNCVDNCPYGVIQLAQITPKQGLLGRLLGRTPAEPPAKTAAKCDSCAGIGGGPACVRACPTGAAFRIHAEEVLTLATERAAAVGRGG